MRKMSEQQADNQRAAGGSQRKFSAARQGNLDFTQQNAQCNRQRKRKEAHRIELDQLSGIVLNFRRIRAHEAFALARNIHLQNFRHQLHKQHYADHAERISDRVTRARELCQISRRLTRRSQTRRTGKRAGKQADRQFRRNTADFNRQHAADRAGQNNQKSEQDIARRIFLKSRKNLGPAMNPTAATNVARPKFLTTASI